jgi:hypothetical protein
MAGNSYCAGSGKGKRALGLSRRVINRPRAGSAVGVELLGADGCISVKVPHHPSELSLHA